MYHKTLDLIFGIGIVLVIIWFVLEAVPWSFHSRLFPWAIGLSVLALALVQVGASLRDLRRPPSRMDAVSEAAFQDPSGIQIVKSSVWRVVSICSWIGLFFAGIWFLGFRVGSLVLTIAFLKLAAGEDYETCLRLGLLNYFFFLAVFELALGVPLFEGALSQWLEIEALDKFFGKELVALWR